MPPGPQTFAPGQVMAMKFEHAMQPHETPLQTMPWLPMQLVQGALGQVS